MRSLPLISVVVAAAAGLAACGSAATRSPSSGHASGPNQLGFAECMRSHGVSGFPDPTPPNAVDNGTNRIFGFALPPTMNMDAPVFKSAVQVCSKLVLPAHRPPRPPSDNAAGLRFAECMRTNGVPDYPDPAPVPASGPIQSFGPNVNLNTPAAKHASSVCGASP